MTIDGFHGLPPPPLFTVRPPPKPPGSLFEHFHPVEIFNGQCIIPSLNIPNTNNNTSILLPKDEQPINNWLNLFLLLLALISVISCIIIAILIFICLKKLKHEEKQYKNYVLTGSLTRNHHSNLCTRTNEHYKCGSTSMNCCDDYYAHQLISLNEPQLSSVHSPHHNFNARNNSNSSSSVVNNTGDIDNTQNHQYECIPEYLLTMTRRAHHPPVVCHHHHRQQQQHPLYHRPNSCTIPYATFSRSLLLSRGVTGTSTSDSSQCTCSPPPPSTTIVQEESSIPLLASSIPKESHQTEENISISSPPKSKIIGWTKRKSTSSTNGIEQRRSFLSQLRKSTVLQ